MEDIVVKNSITDQYFNGYGYKENSYYWENISAIQAKPFQLELNAECCPWERTPELDAVWSKSMTKDHRTFLDMIKLKSWFKNIYFIPRKNKSEF